MMSMNSWLSLTLIKKYPKYCNDEYYCLVSRKYNIKGMMLILSSPKDGLRKANNCSNNSMSNVVIDSKKIAW